MGDLLESHYVIDSDWVSFHVYLDRARNSVRIVFFELVIENNANPSGLRIALTLDYLD